MHPILNRATALLLPHQYVSCRQFADTTGLCAACWSALAPITAPMCRQCGLPLAEMLEDGICAACWATPPKISRIRSALRYDDASRSLILKLKHGDGLQLVPFICRLMAGRFAELTSDDPLVIPIPLHRWRYWRRRFNQSAELARYLCHQHGTGVYSPVLLQRQRATQSQGGLSRQARKRNLAGAFAINPDAARADRPVLLIDDVMTTGATLNAATRVLQRTGAPEVRALTIARVI
jgi:ComF family protein